MLVLLAWVAQVWPAHCGTMSVWSHGKAAGGCGSEGTKSLRYVLNLVSWPKAYVATCRGCKLKSELASLT